MAQLTIYLDGETLKKIEGAARREHESISGWVKKRLVLSLKNSWPAGYFDVFGALSKDNNFKRPEQTTFDQDTSRQTL